MVCQITHNNDQKPGNLMAVVQYYIQQQDAKRDKQLMLAEFNAA